MFSIYSVSYINFVATVVPPVIDASVIQVIMLFMVLLKLLLKLVPKFLKLLLMLIYTTSQSDHRARAESVKIVEQQTIIPQNQSTSMVKSCGLL